MAGMQEVAMGRTTHWPAARKISQIAVAFPIIVGKRIFNFQWDFEAAKSESDDAEVAATE